MATQAMEQGSLKFDPPKFEMSPTIGTLAGALAKARKAFKPIVKSEVNPFFKSKYADLAAVIEATKDGLADNALAVIQPPTYGRDGAVQVITLLVHSSGEWIKTTLDMPISKADAQGVGSAITYGRRYAYSAVLNVASEDDDDANAAVSNGFKKGAPKVETDEEFDQRTADQQGLAVFQIQAIDEACKRTGKTEAEVAAYLNLMGEKRIEHVKRSDFQKLLQWANGAHKKVTERQKAVGSTDKAMKKLFATAAEYHIPEADLKQAAYERFKVASMTELTLEQLEEHADWVKSVAEEQVG